jgi:hypothetical protein
VAVTTASAAPTPKCPHHAVTQPCSRNGLGLPAANTRRSQSGPRARRPSASETTESVMSLFTVFRSPNHTGSRIGTRAPMALVESSRKWQDISVSAGGTASGVPLWSSPRQPTTVELRLVAPQSVTVCAPGDSQTAIPVTRAGGACPTSAVCAAALCAQRGRSYSLSTLRSGNSAVTRLTFVC